MFTRDELQFIAENPDAFSDEEIKKAHDSVMEQPKKSESPWRTAAGVAGGIVGEALALPATIASGPLAPITAAGAGTLGYAGGTGLYDVVNNIINPEEKKDIPEQIKTTGNDIATGATQAMGGPIVSKYIVSPVINKAVKPGLSKMGDILAKYKSIMTKIPKEDIINFAKNGMPSKTGAETATSAQQQLLDNFKKLTQQEGSGLATLLKAQKGQIPLKGIREPWVQELQKAYELKKTHPTPENIKDYDDLLQSYKDKFNISSNPSYSKFQESVDPYSAWQMQHKMVPQAKFGAPKPTSDAVQAAERRAARGSYNAYNEALASETGGLSQEAKNKMTNLRQAEEELGNIVDNPDAMASFLRNYNKPAKQIKSAALKNIASEHPELNIDKQIADMGVINSFENPKVLRNEISSLGLGAGGGTLLHSAGVPALPAYLAALAETSPALLKKEIEALRLGKKVIDYSPIKEDTIIPSLSRYFTAKKEEEE